MLRDLRNVRPNQIITSFDLVRAVQLLRLDSRVSDCGILSSKRGGN
jgi:hypothetical protein